MFVSMTDASGMGQVIQEYEDASSTPTRNYLYGSYVDEPLAQVVGSTIRYYHRDRQFNVVGLTGGGGTLEELYRYTPYGKQEILAPDGTTVRASSAFHAGQTPGHQGLHHDAESGLIYNRARYRNTQLGRWMGRDPLGYIDGFSLLQVLRGNTFTNVDPSGEAVPAIIPVGIVIAKGARALVKLRRAMRKAKAAKCSAIHAAYKAKKNVPGCRKCCDQARTKLAALRAEQAGRRNYLSSDCHRISRLSGKPRARAVANRTKAAVEGEISKLSTAITTCSRKVESLCNS